MISIPWYVLPWSVATADRAHDLALRALGGDQGAKAELREVEGYAAAGNAPAREAWRCFQAVIKLAAAGQPPPSVILQLRGGAAVGQVPGGVPLLPFGWGGWSPWGPFGADPWGYDELVEAVAERAADEAAAEAEAEVQAKQKGDVR